jgi:NitT/TauT family transport system permease protein
VKTSRIKKDIPRYLYISLSLFTFVLFILLWCVLTYGGYVQPFFLSSPTGVIRAARVLLTMQDFLGDIKISILRIVIGFLVSVVIALPTGILIGSFKAVEAVLSPFTSFIRYLPVPALLPFCILWFGIGEPEKIIVVFLGVFFQLVLMVADIVRRTPNELLEISYTLGAGTRQAISKVIVPYSSPHILDSLRITMGWAWGWLMLAELVGASQGIGFMILKSQRYLLNANMIFGLLVLGVLGILTDLLFVGLSKILFKWTE